MRRLNLVAAAVGLLVLPLLPTPALAADLVGTDAPACTTLDPAAPFVVVPVNAGKAFTANSCLAQQAGGTRQVQLFLNGGMPGPAGTHWPGGACAGIQSPGCAELFGEQAAQDALATVTSSGAQLIPRIWWIDVEDLNTWVGPVADDLASIRGTLTALRARPDLVSAVGIYSSNAQWDEITGGDQSLTVPQWSATPMSDITTARRNCSSKASFTKGPVVMVQLQRGDGSDGDLVCPPRLASHKTPHAGTPLTLTGSALPGSAVTLVTHQPDRTIRMHRTTATAAGTWTVTVVPRYTASISVATTAGTSSGGIAIAPVITASVRTGRCSLTAAGTISPRWPGQRVQVVVSGGRSAEVGTSGSGAWHATIAQPCGARVSVQARTTGLGGRTRWASAARGRSIVVRTD